MPEILLYVQSSKRIQNSIFVIGKQIFPNSLRKILKTWGNGISSSLVYQTLFHVNYPYYFQQRLKLGQSFLIWLYFQTVPDLQKFLKLRFSNVVHGWVEDEYLRRILDILKFFQVMVKVFE